MKKKMFAINQQSSRLSALFFIFPHEAATPDDLYLLDGSERRLLPTRGVCIKGHFLKGTGYELSQCSS